jgi:predicted  nucleic acid-binding Zn-ribbon protein
MLSGLKSLGLEKFVAPRLRGPAAAAADPAADEGSEYSTDSDGSPSPGAPGRVNRQLDLAPSPLTAPPTAALLPHDASAVPSVPPPPHPPIQFTAAYATQPAAPPAATVVAPNAPLLGAVPVHSHHSVPPVVSAVAGGTVVDGAVVARLRRELDAAAESEMALNGQLQDALQLLERAKSDCRALDDAVRMVEDENSKLRGERKALLEAATSPAPRGLDENLDRRLQQQDAELEHLTNELRESRASADAAHHAEANRANEKVLALERDLHEVRGQNAALTKELEAVRGVAHASADSNAQLQQARSEIASLTTQLNQTVAARDAARNFSSRDRAALAAAEKRIAQMEATLAASAGHSAAAAAAGPDSVSGAAAPAASSVQDQALRAAEEARAAARQRVEALEAAVRDHEKSAQALTAERDDFARRENALRAQLEKDAAAFEAERNGWDARLATAEATRAQDAAAAAALQQQLQGAQQQLQQLQAAVSREAQLKDEAERRASATSAEVARLREEHAASRQGLSSSAEAARQASGALQAERDAAAAKCSALASQLERVSKESRELSQALEVKSDQLRARERALAEAQQHLAEEHQRADELQRRVDTDTSAKMHKAQAAEAVTATVDELSTEVKRMRDRAAVIHQACADAVAKFRVPPRPNAQPSDPAAPTLEGTDGSTVAVQKLLAEFVNASLAFRDSRKALEQWEGTYVQARDVNNSLKQQLDAARAELKTVKEDAALKKASLDRVSGNANQNSARVNELQLQVNRLDDELQAERGKSRRLADELQNTNRRLADLAHLEGDAAAHTNAIRQLQEEHERDLAEARASVANMEKVLAAFQKQKAHEIDERSRYLSFELDDVKQQLLRAQDAVGAARADAENQIRAMRKELATKNNTIASLQGKLGDLRLALEQTMSRVNDSNTIDKRVVSHLLVNYVASVRERRGDDTDIVRVMAGLLNWDANAMRRVGLIETVTTDAEVPRGPGGSVVLGWGKSLLSNVGGRLIGATPGRTAPRPTAAAPSANSGGTVQQPSASSLAQMWVDFLIKESDGSTTPSSAAAEGGHTTAPHASDGTAVELFPPAHDPSTSQQHSHVFPSSGQAPGSGTVIPTAAASSVTSAGRLSRSASLSELPPMPPR